LKNVHDDEPHDHELSSRLNGLRAAVLGANDGIVSTAGLVVGVAGATIARGPIVTAGIAGLLAGAISMAVGEYVSVSTQRDTEKALLSKERAELKEKPAAELAELAQIYEDKGLKPGTAWQVAVELTEHDAFTAHAEAELRIDPDDLTNPWQAAIASFFSFALAALLPILAISLPPVPLRVPVTFGAVVIALALTGAISARLGGADTRHAVIRVVAGGAIAMIVTFVAGQFLGDFAGI